MDPRILVFLGAILAFIVNSNAKGVETGRAAPDCKLLPIGGTQRHDLQQYHGKVVYVDFWASWCPPCAQSFPFMNQLHHQLADWGLRIVGINLDEKPDDAKDFLAKHPADFAVVFDTEGNCRQNFGVKAMPSSYLVDRQGNIRHVHLGFRPGEADQLRARVEQLLAESPSAH